jgi:hypothetical protein
MPSSELAAELAERPCGSALQVNSRGEFLNLLANSLVGILTHHDNFHTHRGPATLNFAAACCYHRALSPFANPRLAKIHLCEHALTWSTLTTADSIFTFTSAPAAR